MSKRSHGNKEAKKPKQAPPAPAVPPIGLLPIPGLTSAQRAQAGKK
jgi:hypothetical protein